ncbi:MAG TPA: molybdopterin converting factor subunit 1 [Polyangiaceae bacterium]|nr:molybdopterin converting factor subunit 1 [Polyangiaceae bacterium]
MTITLLYFAGIREAAGRSEERLVLPPSVTTIGELALHLETLLPALAGRLGAVRWARNEEFAALDSVIANGDVVAAIPPVAGG